MMLTTVEKCGRKDKSQNMTMEFRFTAFSMNLVCCFCAVIELPNLRIKDHFLVKHAYVAKKEKFGHSHAALIAI